MVVRAAIGRNLGVNKDTGVLRRDLASEKASFEHTTESGSVPSNHFQDFDMKWRCNATVA